MSFINKLPNDYYSTKIIKDFNNFPKNIDYNKKIYERNNVLKGKLTLNHIEFIEFYVRLLKPKNFLELGVQFGECTENIIKLIPEKYIGVDIYKDHNIDYLKKKYSQFEFFHTDTNTFFKKLDKKYKFEMAFIDACHTHEQTYIDFLNIKDYIKNDGFIFFHDCYPASKEWTTNSLCGDCYKTSEIIRKKHNNEFEILTIPVNPGISIARKCVKQLEWL